MAAVTDERDKRWNPPACSGLVFLGQHHGDAGGAVVVRPAHRFEGHERRDLVGVVEPDVKLELQFGPAGHIAADGELQRGKHVPQPSALVLPDDAIRHPDVCRPHGGGHGDWDDEPRLFSSDGHIDEYAVGEGLGAGVAEDERGGE